MAGLEPHVLSHALDWVYAVFFYGDHAKQLQNLPEVLFGHFVTTLNDTFKVELAQEDEGYESGTENHYIPTPLSRNPQVVISPSIWELQSIANNSRTTG